MDVWKKKTWGVFSVVVMSGCAAEVQEQVVELPRVVVECPDPDDRRRLGQGDTFRDLARVHAEAVNGWQRCFDAAEINGGVASQ